VIKLKSIKLINYCGYKDFELDLTSGEEVSRWAMFYGPNGIGKSNFIRAVELLSSPRTLRGRLDNKLFLRRLTYHQNYQPSFIKRKLISIWGLSSIQTMVIKESS